MSSRRHKRRAALRRARRSKRAPNRRPEEVVPVADRTVRRRMIVVAVGLTVALSVATGRAVVLQTTESSVLQREARKNYVRTEVLDDWRGDIVDKDGALLAVTVHRWAVTADPSQIVEPAETAAVLAPIVGMSPTEVLERIDPATARPAHEEAQVRNPATRLARSLTTPYVRLMSRMWETPRARLDGRLDVLESFFQLEQLQTPAVFGIARRVAEASETAAGAVSAGAERLRLLPSRGRKFAYIGRDLDDQTVQALKEARTTWAKHCRTLREEGERCHNPLAHVFTRPEPRRYYPKRQLAAELLGLVGSESRGLSGVELGMDAILAGKGHSVRAVKDKSGRRIYLNGLPAEAPLSGPTVELTIDQELQAVAERELAKACLSSGARAGYMVAMEVRTGEVLAVANFPGYNPNTFQQLFRDRRPLDEERAALAQRRAELAFAAEWPAGRAAHPGQDEVVRREAQQALSQAVDAFVEYQHGFPNAARNSAFLDVYEPGSIIKVFTAAAALEEGVVDLTEVFDLEGGDWELHDAEDNVIHDVNRLDEGNLGAILKKSSNIGAAKLGFRLGAQTLERYLRAFGFGHQTKSGVPGEARGLLRPAAEWVPVELANISFGQGMAVTGIQLVRALAGLANGGELMRPIVVRRILDDKGRVIRHFEPESVRRVVSEKTARTVLDLMQEVVAPDGTGRRAYLPEYPVAGKTGTGQKPHLRKNGYSEEMWVNTFFGVAPANDPQIALVVLIDEPSGKRHGGGLIAAPAFRKVMDFALPHLGIASPYTTGTRQAWLDPDVLKARRALPAEPSDDLAALAPPVDFTRGGAVPVPDFRGMTMDAARRLAAQIGLEVQLYGSGLVIAQDVPPHERVPGGTIVTLTFQTGAPGLHRAPTITRDGDYPELPTPRTSVSITPGAEVPSEVLPTPPVFDAGGRR